MKINPALIVTIIILLIFTLFPVSIAVAIEPEPDIPPEPENPPEPQRVVYLTFDDGPSRNITTAVLDILKQEGVVATFYVLVMKNVDDVYWRIINEGHQLGNHTTTHNYYKVYRSGLEAFKNEVRKNHEFILDNFGYDIKTFRFPGAGSLAKPADWINARKSFLHYEMGYRDFGWHISGDEGASHIFRATKRLEPTTEHIIILFHDGSGRNLTPGIITDVIAGFKEKGYAFDTMYNFPLSPAEKARIQEQRQQIRENEILEMQLVILTSESLED